MKYKNIRRIGFKAILLTILSLGFAGQSYAGAILLTQFDFQDSGGVNVYAQMKANLEAAGHTVDIVDAKTGGNVSTALGSKTYDQVFLWDLSGTPYLNAADIAALDAFWDPSMGIVVDTRSYGHYFQGADPSEVALLQNVANALDLSGGGLWIGTDHAPAWTNNANPVLGALGFDLATGSFSDPVNFADPTSFLLNGVTPTDLWASGASVAQAPIGVQANGVEMFIHFGNTRADGSILPYVSASFDLEGPPDPENPPTTVPAPATLFLFGLGLVGLSWSRRKKA